jgi:predicted HTH transcriptional regulator
LERAETRAVEFKESQPFEILQWKLLKTCMAMANLRDGGLIVIGVDERNGLPSLSGVSPTHLKTYTQDALIALVNRHARPPVTLTLRVVEHAKLRYIGIEVRPFDRVPIFCGVATPKHVSKEALAVGDIPARTQDRISTSRVHDVDLVAEIIEIAAEKRAREIIAMSQRIGLRLPDSGDVAFRRERLDFGDFDQ